MASRSYVIVVRQYRWGRMLLVAILAAIGCAADAPPERRRECTFISHYRECIRADLEPWLCAQLWCANVCEDEPQRCVPPRADGSTLGG